MFYDKSLFDFCSILEKNYKEILNDYKSVEENTIDWFEKDLNPEKKWDVFPIYDWPSGRAVEGFTQKVPFTANLIKTYVRGRGACGFSILRAGSFIPPHKGYQGKFLRCQLGLIIPEGDTAIKVNGETKGWSEGECIVFDDRLEHEAWNSTEQDRVILIIDFLEELYK